MIIFIANPIVGLGCYCHVVFDFLLFYFNLQFGFSVSAEVEKVSEPGNVVPRIFLGLNFHRKFSRKY